MDHGRDLATRRLSREDLLKLAAAAGGAAIVGGEPALRRPPART